jgi:branched-chain amino acid transport system ATP-binding protein
MNKILEVKNLSVSYGTVKALQNASFFVSEGEIVAMVGPNGAGKSTALKAICGLIQADIGEIRFEDKNIKGLSPDALVKKALCLVPEGRRIFGSMTVLENLEMGAFTLRRSQAGIVRERMDEVSRLFPVLKERSKQRAGTLSGGEQQMLAIGRALMLKPSLLLLDEPSLGLSPNYVETVFERLRDINRNGTSILIVEQNARKAIEVCHRGYVFQVGSIALEGDRESLLDDERIKNGFLGC